MYYLYVDFPAMLFDINKLANEGGAGELVGEYSTAELRGLLSRHTWKYIIEYLSQTNECSKICNDVFSNNTST